MNENIPPLLKQRPKLVDNLPQATNGLFAGKMTATPCTCRAGFH